MTRTERLLAIVLRLQTGGWHRAADLAERFGVSVRTIYRDMPALEQAGVPLVGVPGTGYRLRDDDFLPPYRFSSDEAFVLLTAADGESIPALGPVRDRLREELPDRLRRAAKNRQEAFRFVPAGAFRPAVEAAVLRDLRRAVREQRCVRLEFRKGESTPTFHPYSLVQQRAGWQLVGYDTAQQRVRHVPLQEIGSVKLLGDSFERPPGYHLDGLQEETGATSLSVEVLFTPDAAPLVEMLSDFPIVATETRSDGLLVTFDVRREEDIMPWLLGWGAQACVLAPASLRQRLAQETERMASRYRETAPGLL